MVQRSRDVMREVIDGKTDEEIMGFVQNMGGVEALLDICFQGMEDALVPEKAQDCVIAFEIAENGTTHNFTVTVKNKKAIYESRAATDARVTFALTFIGFLRLITGLTEGMKAFMEGTMKVTGDMMFAQEMPAMFGI